GAAGTVSFTVNVTDTAGGTLSRDYTITVNPPVSIAPASLPEGTATAVYNHTLTVSGGTKPYTAFAVNNFSAGGTGLSAGDITTDATAGTIAIHGTPPTAGSASFTVDVTDTAGATLARDYTITVNVALSIDPATLPQGTAGAAYQHTLTVAGGTVPYTTLAVNNFSAGATGLTAADFATDASTGMVMIHGTPS